MVEPRERRIVRRGAIALVVMGPLLLYSGGQILREPPEIDRSRGIRLGMTDEEVRAVMGDPDSFSFRTNESDLMFGESVRKRWRFWFSLRQWPILKSMAPKVEEWPVRVHFDQSRLVDQIVRGGVVEMSTEDATSAAQ